MAIKITTVRRAHRRCSREVRAQLERRRRRPLLLRPALITTLVSGVALGTTLFYCYHAAAHLVDARLANGYLTSRAGIYAAPRVLRAGQGMLRERVLAHRRRGGFRLN